MHLGIIKLWKTIKKNFIYIIMTSGLLILQEQPGTNLRLLHLTFAKIIKYAEGGFSVTRFD